MRSELPWLSSLVGVYLTAVGWRCASSNLKHVLGPGVRCGTQGAMWRSLWWSHKVTAPPGCADIQSKSSRLVFLSGSLSIFGGTFPLYVSFAPISYSSFHVTGLFFFFFLLRIFVSTPFLNIEKGVEKKTYPTIQRWDNLNISSFFFFEAYFLKYG